MPLKDKNKRKLFVRKYYEAHREHILNNSRERYLKSRDKRLDMAEQYRKDNTESILKWQKEYRLARPDKGLLSNAKERAKKLGLEFNLSIEDIKIPRFCPVLGIPLKVNKGKVGPSSPTLDRIDNTRGYVKDNVIVVSHRANTIKSSARLEELRFIWAFYSQYEENDIWYDPDDQVAENS